MKCSVLISLMLTMDIVSCNYTNSYNINTVPKETTIKYKVKPNDITIPIMIHIDKSLTETLPKESNRKTRAKFKLLAADILKDVEELFNQPNLHLKVKLELLDLKLLKNSTKAVVMNENVSQYLKSYCVRQGQMKKMKRKWYYSVLFTGLDVFYFNNRGVKVRSSTGRGYMNGVCSENNSCTLLEWHPEDITYVLAHEIAHSLGIFHDGPPHNDCHGQRSIMDAKYNPRHSTKIWSTCSRIHLDQFLKSKLGWCLRQDVDNLTFTKYL